MPINQEARDLQLFANALRAALGLCPLYGADVSFGGIETIEDPLGHSRTDDWFHAAEIDDRSTRDGRRDASIEARIKRKKISGADRRRTNQFSRSCQRTNDVPLQEAWVSARSAAVPSEG